LQRHFLARIYELQRGLRFKDIYYRVIGQLEMLKELKAWKSCGGLAGAWQPADVWIILQVCPWTESFDISGYGQFQALELPQEGSEEAPVNTSLWSLFINAETGDRGMVAFNKPWDLGAGTQENQDPTNQFLVDMACLQVFDSV
jgi:hypothetical protein